MTAPTVALLLYPDFNPFQFAIPQRVFSLNVDDKPLFHLKIVAEHPDCCYGENGIYVPADGDLRLLERADMVIAFGWQPEKMPSDALKQALIRANQRGALVAGLCYGAYLLAYSGLLNGKEATTHWLGEADFAKRFPAVKLSIEAIYIEQGSLMTSAGTAAALDCCLAIIRRTYGVKIANQIARILVVSPHREGGQAQFIEQPIARLSPSENMSELLAQMQQNLKQDYRIDALAKRLNMSRSTFTRHFRQATGVSLTEWLIALRLQRGRELLENTGLGIEHIASEIGFHSATAFRQHFRKKHRVSPRMWRRGGGDENDLSVKAVHHKITMLNMEWRKS
ncbi:GlxA family transcriptional regulator [Avibacterium sp. 21-599]|uniref:GlxA family transcriptional regulator n=1 Tax=Avibacterium sp. 21-599 TaxID=2911528 RepID=UPI0022463957|nr:helix-turn-helix domain-containing protein [Avibacterium sp. 21-599]MCW9718861.1 helix-turn-helix domain-containing protein [Avibacterium sp. 21-599]